MFADDRAGIKLIMFWGLWAPLILGFGSVYRYNQLKKIDLKKIRKSSASKSRKMSETIEEPAKPFQS